MKKTLKAYTFGYAYFLTIHKNYTANIVICEILRIKRDEVNFMIVPACKISKITFLLAIFCCFSFIYGQEKDNSPSNKTIEQSDDEVLRIATALVQTGVQVFDKSGQFVDNLEKADFELLVEGDPIPISFFEQNTFGKNIFSRTEKRPVEKKSSSQTDGLPNYAVGRNIIFVVDDFHLSFDSTVRTRKLITKFIEQEMLSEDMVAIVSPSGRLGFLQQFTNDKTVLDAALGRLSFTKSKSANDPSPPPMTEYEALLISLYDRDVTDFFASRSFGTDMDSKRETVRMRARTILSQAAAINRGTYSALEQTIRNSAPLAGRKIVFFISDGFLLDLQNTNSSYLLQRIYDAAARTNAVIYSLDAKGLEAGLLGEGATSSSQVLGYRTQSGERFEKQDGLSLLADKTGGQFIHNTNDLQAELTKSIREASRFYLLAWEPTDEKSSMEKFKKIEVRIKNRPELKVRMQNGYLTEAIETGDKKRKKISDKQNGKQSIVLAAPEQQLKSAVNALYPIRSLPTALTVNYIDVLNEGALLAATMQISSNTIEFTAQNDQATAGVDIVGIIYNEDGKREGYFRELVNLEMSAAKLTQTDRPNIYYNYQTKLKPGLYQVRVAARDVKSGRIGNAVQWIKIPDLSDRKLNIGSLILSEQADGEDKTARKNSVANFGSMQLPVSVERNFERTSRMRYLLFIYNAAQKPKPDLTVQIQVLRGKNTVLKSAPAAISIEGNDLTRLPFAAEIPLSSLTPGHYELQITIQDRISKNEATKRIDFEIR